MGLGYTMELVACESVILNELTHKEMTQRQIAQTYALALRSSEAKTLDWRKINEAIIARWSKAGLERIKKMAWSGKCFEEPAPTQKGQRE